MSICTLNVCVYIDTSIMSYMQVNLAPKTAVPITFDIQTRAARAAFICCEHVFGAKKHRVYDHNHAGDSDRGVDGAVNGHGCAKVYRFTAAQRREPRARLVPKTRFELYTSICTLFV